MKNKVLDSTKKERLLYTIILVIFVVLSTLVSLKHEYWADEANTWLLARDGNIIQLFTKYMSNNGHPFTFIFIIKIFQLFGLNYSNFHIISILFSSIGIGLLLFKSNYKWYLKILLPFTYFIFYQYTVITRGYCLLLLLFSVLALIWEKRKEHYWLYTLLLIILINLEAYTFLIAGSLYLLELIDFFKNKNKDKKTIICLIILFLSFLITTIYMFPKSNNTTGISIKDLSIADAFLYSHSLPYFLSIIITIGVVGIIIYTYLKNNKKKELLETAIIFIPVYLFFNFYYCNYWHSGILFILFLFLFWIHKIDNTKLIKVLLLITCFVQIYWSYKSSINDYKYTYSPTKEVADFIKEYDYDNTTIYCNNYLCSAINPYFQKNIFALWPDNVGFYYESNNNPNYLFDYEADNILETKPDILIIANSSNEDKIEESHDKYSKLLDQYELHTFRGQAYFKDTVIKEFAYDVYVKKA